MSVNPILLQKALRENAADLEDFSKDLKKWGEEMKRKEDTLKNPNQRTTPSNKIRKVSKREKTELIKHPVTKVGTTDYAAWEKFDVDAELQKLEEDATEDSELTDECNENMIDEAIVEKEKGNKFVKNQKWDEAIECYTKAIDYYSYDPIFYANRALCHLKKLNFAGAEKDCNLSLKLDGTYVKAYQRRAAARIALCKLEHAESDLLKVLEIEPKNKESCTELEKLRQKMRKIDKPPEQRPVSKFTASRNKSYSTIKPNTNYQFESANLESNAMVAEKLIDDSKPISPWPEIDDIVLVKPFKKPPHSRSQKPLRRIEIKEVDGIQNETKLKESSNVSQQKQDIAIKQNVIENIEPISRMYDKDIIVERTEEVSRVSAFKAKKNNQSHGNVNHPTICPKTNPITDCLKSDDLKVIEKLPTIKDAKNNSNIEIINHDNKTVDGKTDYNFDVPKSYVQFTLTWKNLKIPEMKYKYLKSIDPVSLPKIFLESLESDIFSNILEILVEYFIENKDSVWEVLESFTQVKRFSVITTFLSSEDRSCLWKLFDYIKEYDKKYKDSVDILIQKYNM